MLVLNEYENYMKRIGEATNDTENELFDSDIEIIEKPKEVVNVTNKDDNDTKLAQITTEESENLIETGVGSGTLKWKNKVRDLFDELDTHKVSLTTLITDYDMDHKKRVKFEQKVLKFMEKVTKFMKEQNKGKSTKIESLKWNTKSTVIIKDITNKKTKCKNK